MDMSVTLPPFNCSHRLLKHSSCSPLMTLALTCAADDNLSVWHKRAQPFLQYPPENLPLVGWRDPYIFEMGGDGKEWGMLLGSGLKGKGGAVLIYRSASLQEGERPVAVYFLEFLHGVTSAAAQTLLL